MVTMSKTKSLQNIPESSPVSISIEAIITQAIANNVPIETMEKILAMRRELKQEYAKEQFNKSMSAFQAECPAIIKTKVVKTNSGQDAYRFAPLDAIIAQTKELIRAHGFSYRIQTETLTDSVKSTCIVQHSEGHSEQSSFEVPLGNRTNVMSQTQVVAAALTFAKRYAFCNAFGIMTSDEDTDAKKETLSPIEAIDKLKGALTLEELKITYLSLGNLTKNEAVALAKDTRKAELEHFIPRRVNSATEAAIIHEAETLKKSKNLSTKPLTD